ncbi:hypothetical protein [Streptomyces sp. LN245]|uniref:hypothetical protein n=1 Tax=Streptomyces sp. LN245 TaxID=3112975 RepID=UPI00371D36FC
MPRSTGPSVPKDFVGAWEGVLKGDVDYPRRVLRLDISTGRSGDKVAAYIDPEPGRTEDPDNVSTRDVIYVVDETGKCVAGPGNMDAFWHQRLTVGHFLRLQRSGPDHEGAAVRHRTGR